MRLGIGNGGLKLQRSKIKSLRADPDSVSL